jgi:hypothetical protein
LLSWARENLFSFIPSNVTELPSVKEYGVVFELNHSKWILAENNSLKIPAY